MSRVSNLLYQLKKQIRIPYSIEFVDDYVPEEVQEEYTLYIHIDIEGKDYELVE